MGIVNYTILRSDREIQLIAWTGLANGDTGQPYDASDAWPEKSVQVVGTFGVGGNVAIEGSNMLTSPTWNGLTDPQGNLLEFTVSKLEAILENTVQIRPNVTGGDVTTSISVYIAIRRGYTGKFKSHI